MSLSNCSLKILFIPLDATGHVNACVGLAQIALKKGHKVLFAIPQTWRGKLSRYGFDEEVYIDPEKGDGNGPAMFTEFFQLFADGIPLSPFEKLRKFEQPGWEPMCGEIKRTDHLIAEIIKRTKPDVIVSDAFICIPAMVNAASAEGIPWVNLVSCNQLYCTVQLDLPPGGSGYATMSDKELWRAFREETIDAYKEDWNSYNTWVQQQGAEPLKDPTRFYNPSPYLNLYLCPDELDYTDIRPRPDKWHNIDWLMREEKDNDCEKFDLTKEFGPQWENIKASDDKIVYLSMGSIGAADVKLMKRLVAILSNSPHRIIVSKGPLGDEYELAENMVGKNHVPQTKILPLVDCVITHGGNNTLTETLYYGKPMIVMPIFSDQYDNAQRMVEKNLGERCDPYYCGEKELLDKVEKLLGDKELKERLNAMGKRMQQSKSKERAVELIEKLVKETKNGKQI